MNIQADPPTTTSGSTVASPGRAFGTKRNLGIDFIRGFSIFVVMGVHELIPHRDLDRLLGYPLLDKVFGNGFYGVSIFFVISGFLITRNCLERYGSLSRIDLPEFYVTRIGRIAPCLLLFLGMYLALYAIGMHAFNPGVPILVWTGIQSALTLQYNTFFLTLGNVPGLRAMAPLWSLSLEELFYLLFPIFCFFCRRTWVIVVLGLALIVLGPVARQDWGQIYCWWGCCDLLAMGCIGGLLSYGRLSRNGTRLGAIAARLAGAVIIATTFLWAPVQQNASFGPSLVGVGAIVFLLGCVHDRRANKQTSISKRWFFILVFPFLGWASYTVYLFHIMFSYGLVKIHNRFLTVFILVGFCAIVELFFSNPLNARIRRFYAGSRVSQREKEVAHLRTA